MRLEEAAANDVPSVLRDSLRELLTSKVSLSTLIESQLARHVKKRLARHPDDEVARLARQLVGEWSRLLVTDGVLSRASSISGETHQHELWHDDDAIQSILAKVDDALTLLALKATSVGWRARVSALGCTPYAVTAAAAPGHPPPLDVTITLASGGDWWVHTELLLRTAHADTVVLCARHPPLPSSMACIETLSAVGAGHFRPSDGSTWLSSAGASLTVNVSDALAAINSQQPAWPSAANSHIFSGDGPNPLPRRLAIAALMRVLVHPVRASLQSLRLAGRQLRDDGAAAVARCCADMPSLHSVDLSHCQIGSTSAALTLAELLAHNRAITSLSLKGNPLGSAGVSPLMMSLRRNTASAKLHSLDLSATGM